MASVLPGYEYDIFISYRQKDNKHDGWVTEFVDNLKGELESSFKEEIGVYFDINPHDGLLETHDVDASLKEKLKCLVFIPIISRTYCDPNSFAWEHEFKAFVEQASQDQFGLKVKLPNGNVSNRVLPVRIHDLDHEDNKLCESVLGGVLRGVEFIYKESGFNRPLKPDDDEKINLNKTKYRNQITKVTLAIKEIISGLKAVPAVPVKEITPDRERPAEVQREKDLIMEKQPAKRKLVKSGKRLKIAFVVASLLVIISATLFIVIKPFSDGKNKLEKTIAVLPFIDDSPDKGNTYIINGLFEEILDKLEKINDLKVKSRTATEKYRDSKLSIGEIGRSLKVNYILEGSGQKIQDRIKIRLQLIEVQSGNHVWSKPYVEEVNDERIFELQENVALSVADELKAIITPEEKEKVAKKPTENLAAYKLYLQGLDYLNVLKYNEKSDELEIRKAKHFFEEAIKLDSTFVEAYVRLGHIFIDIIGIGRPAKLDSGLMMANKALLYNEKHGWAYSLRGTYYLRKGMLEKARNEYDKSFEYQDNNYYGTHQGKFYVFLGLVEFYNALKSYYKYQELKPEEILTKPEMIRRVYECFINLGYPETARKYAKLLLQQNNDSLQYLYNLSQIELYLGNFKAVLDFGLKIQKMDTTLTTLYHLGFCYFALKDYTEAYKYILEIENELKKTGNKQGTNLWIGYIYLKNNQIKKADYHFDGSIILLLKQLESDHLNAQWNYTYLDLANIYAARGEKEKAIKNLKLLKNLKTNYLWLVFALKHSPMLDNIRNEPEFAEVLKDVEAKYQKEHERAGELIKEYEGK